MEGAAPGGGHGEPPGNSVNGGGVGGARVWAAEGWISNPKLVIPCRKVGLV
jgi:hypothetical protein